MSSIEDRLLRLEALIGRIMRSDQKLSDSLCSRCTKDSVGSVCIGLGQVAQFCDDHREEVWQMGEESNKKWLEYEREQTRIREERRLQEATKPRKKRWGIV